MPYIKQSNRPEIDKLLAPLVKKLRTPGDFNYVISRLAWMIANQEGIDYNTLNALIGVMEAAKLEFYRRIVAPYENSKVAENGDVFTTEFEVTPDDVVTLSNAPRSLTFDSRDFKV